VNTLHSLSDNIRVGLKGCVHETPLLTAHLDALGQICLAVGVLYQRKQAIIQLDRKTSASVDTHTLSTLASNDSSSSKEGSIHSESDWASTEDGDGSQGSGHGDDHQSNLDARSSHSVGQVDMLRGIGQLLHKSQHSIISFLYNQNPRDLNQFEPVDPPCIAAAVLQYVCSGISERTSPEHFRLEEVYREYHSQLV
jgi:hypothetical protein